jgi:hypothetical protein
MLSRMRLPDPDLDCTGSRIRIRKTASQAHLQRAIESKTFSVNPAVILKTVPKTTHDIYIYIKADISCIQWETANRKKSTNDREKKRARNEILLRLLAQISEIVNAFIEASEFSFSLQQDGQPIRSSTKSFKLIE